MDSDSPTGLEDEQDFFESYDAERAKAELSSASLSFDELEVQPPTPEQLAHAARFRRPVALVVASMALMSMVALVEHGSLQRGSERELVAHYGAALAAPVPSASATETVEQTAPVPEAQSAATPEASFVPEAWSAFLSEVLSALVPDASSAAALGTGVTDPALVPASSNTEISAQPDSVSAFVSALTPMCLRLASRDNSLARPAPRSTCAAPAGKLGAHGPIRLR
ncbi:MAG: hypothetical protein WDO69_28790 [Pseudomonadota bacterium]